MSIEESIVKYLFSRSGCIHPYRVSRLLLLAEWRYIEKYGKRLTSLTYKALPFAMYVEELPDIIDKDPCLEKKRLKKPDGSEYGCVSYECPQPPSLLRPTAPCRSPRRYCQAIPNCLWMVQPNT